MPDKNGHTYKVGDGAHYGWNGDRYPLTVVMVSDSGREVLCSIDKYEIVDNRGGYVEGDRACEFTTVTVDPSDMIEYRLKSSGPYKGIFTKGKSPWDILWPGRCYAQNPSF